MAAVDSGHGGAGVEGGTGVEVAHGGDRTGHGVEQLLVPARQPRPEHAAGLDGGVRDGHDRPDAGAGGVDEGVV
ncbi:MAG TPA: hypothetical protein VMU14_10015, partial [Acidimicrobiales bacterium]|nr:hypothetical protein [Acidimicrobiales bacterium]